jgi:hypothetical protein
MNGCYGFNTFKNMVLDVVTDQNMKKELGLLHGVKKRETAILTTDFALVETLRRLHSGSFPQNHPFAKYPEVRRSSDLAVRTSHASTFGLQGVGVAANSSLRRAVGGFVSDLKGDGVPGSTSHRVQAVARRRAQQFASAQTKSDEELTALLVERLHHFGHTDISLPENSDSSRLTCGPGLMRPVNSRSEKILFSHLLLGQVNK